MKDFLQLGTGFEGWVVGMFRRLEQEGRALGKDDLGAGVVDRTGRQRAAERALAGSHPESGLGRFLLKCLIWCPHGPVRRQAGKPVLLEHRKEPLFLFRH